MNASKVNSGTPIMTFDIECTASCDRWQTTHILEVNIMHPKFFFNKMNASKVFFVLNKMNASKVQGEVTLDEPFFMN
jgi:hypothetical protein